VAAGAEIPRGHGGEDGADANRREHLPPTFARCFEESFEEKIHAATAEMDDTDNGAGSRDGDASQ
jgi:hypothetical protein